MATLTYKKIVLKGDPLVNEDSAAAAAITPGHLVELTSSGTVQKNSDDAANVAFAVALEQDELSRDISDAYATGDTVKVGVFSPGMHAYCFIPSGQNVAIGDYLTGDTGGRLTKGSVSASVRIARALDAVNAVADTRIRVEVV